MTIALPEWLVSEAANIPDAQLAYLVRQQIEVAETRENARLMKREQLNRYWQTYRQIYRSLSLWQRLKVRTGFLKI